MKMKLYIIMLFCLMVGMYSCYDDDTTSGRKEVSLLTITAAHDTLTTSFGEELVVNHLKIEQSGEELPLTYADSKDAGDHYIRGSGYFRGSRETLPD